MPGARKRRELIRSTQTTESGKRIRKKKQISIARRHQGVPEPLSKKGNTAKEDKEEQEEKEKDLQKVRGTGKKQKKKEKQLGEEVQAVTKETAVPNAFLAFSSEESGKSKSKRQKKEQKVTFEEKGNKKSKGQKQAQKVVVEEEEEEEEGEGEEEEGTKDVDGEGEDDDSDFSGLSDDDAQSDEDGDGDGDGEGRGDDEVAIDQEALLLFREESKAKLAQAQAQIDILRKKQQSNSSSSTSSSSLPSGKSSIFGPVEGRGVLYLGHLPFGFFEDQIKGFFSQFGRITRLRLARNKKGKSKHFAFLEFSEREVAQVVAEAFDKYMMFGRVIKCELIPNSDVHPQCFKGANKKFKPIPWKKISVKQHNKKRTGEEQIKRNKSLLQREKKRKKKLAEAGIEYEYGGYAALIKQRPAEK